MNAAVSSRDVAARAGVSQPTVSRVLAGMRVRADTRDRVLSAAAELGYRPNLVGRLLQGRAVRIAVIVEDGDRELAGVLGDVADSLGVAGLSMEVFQVRAEEIGRVAEDLTASGFDRVIARGQAHADRR